MLVPEVVGFRLRGALPEGATATDLVLRVVEMLRKHGVVGKFVEFFGDGLPHLSLADRATIANMAPEYGATCGIFPVDAETLSYLRFSGRPKERVDLVEAYCKAQGLFHTPSSPEASYSATLDLDLASVVPSMAGPARPQDRVALTDMKPAFAKALGKLKPSGVAAGNSVPVKMNGHDFTLSDGSVVIAAVTSCTNTSNPSVMVAAGLVAKKAVERGLATKPWVKTSLAPGSKVVTEYLKRAGLMAPLEKLGFHVVGYGCTTCIGNSGPLPDAVAEAIPKGDLVAVSVLSGNRNFEGRVHQQVRANYLASPPLVVAYALAGRVDFDPYEEPLGKGKDGQPVFLKDVWPSQKEIRDTVRESLQPDMFSSTYSDVFRGSDSWRALEIPEGDTYAWDAESTYVASPPYFEDMPKRPAPIADVVGARVLALLGDSITTDHISPAGAIAKSSPAAAYLKEHGVAVEDFNTYGSRRGNHEVMMRGTFANIRLRNHLVPGTEGGYTVHLPDGEPTSIFDASVRYREEGVPTIVLAGKEYGSGSSRDWAAKGPALLGVRAAIAQSFERIHRSNLIGMGVLPLEFRAGESVQSLGLTGKELYDLKGLSALFSGKWEKGKELEVVARGEGGSKTAFRVVVRIDTPQEVEYYRHGGILHYVLRRLLAS
jgi:aconitate hydratase